MCCRWVLTVLFDRCSSSWMYARLRPFANSIMTSVSRSESPQRSATARHFPLNLRRFSVGSKSTAKARSRSVNAAIAQAITSSVPAMAQG